MAYGKYKYATIKGEKGTTWEVEIWQKDFSASSTDMTLSGEGFEIKWSGQGGTRDRQFLASECVLSVFVQNQTDEDWIYDDVLVEGDKYHFIRIYKNTVSDANLWWFGYLQPSFDAIENTPFPYEVNLTATDSYGFYSKLKKSEFSTEASKNSPYKIKDILLDIGSKMSLANTGLDDDTPVPVMRNWLRTSIDWWRPEDTYQSDDPFNIYKAARGAFAPQTETDDDGVITNIEEALKYKSYDVFNGVLKTFNTVGFLAEGYYYFIQPNSLANNTSATLKTWQYRDSAIGGTDVGNITPLLTIDQSNNVILSGSSLIYEPSLESVTVDYTLGDSTFFISPGADLTTSFVAGGIQAPTDTDEYFTLEFYAIHQEQITTADFSFTSFNPTPSIDIPSTVRNSSFLTTATAIISITDGTTTKYLQPSPSPISSADNNLVWTASGTPLSITIKRGYNAQGGLSSSYAVGDTSNYISEQNGLIYDDSQGPCSRNIYPNDSTPHYKFKTDIYFSANVDAPGIQGSVSIQVTASNDYSEVYEYGYGPTFDLTAYTINSLNDPTPTSTSTTCGDISLYFSGNSEYNNTASEYEYSAEQTEVPSNESLSLGTVVLGSSQLNELYSIQYENSSGINTPAMEFQRGNPTPDDPENITQLLVNEFLSLQVEPLEILQADIQSADISPLKLIKYSINDNTTYKYYAFMGGTFKAQSEIMSGEWYKVNSQESYITWPEPAPTEFIGTTTGVAPTKIYNEIAIATANTNTKKFADEAYGVLDADLTTATSVIKLELSANNQGKIYDNQKMRLSFPDGSNATILTSDGDNLTSSDQINIDSFTPRMTYPSGSIITPLPYDLTNVITGGGTPGGSSKEVQFNDGGVFGAEATFEYDKTTNFLTADNIEGQHYGDNIGVVNGTTIHLSPTDFQVTTTTGVVMYTRDHLGSVQPSSYVSRSKVYASTYIPEGYKVTDVDVYSSANRDIEVFTSRTISDATTSRGTGISNTTLTLAPAWDCVVGDYIIIYFEFGASSDKIYGSKITIAKI